MYHSRLVCSGLTLCFSQIVRSKRIFWRAAEAEKVRYCPKPTQCVLIWLRLSSMASTQVSRLVYSHYTPNQSLTCLPPRSILLPAVGVSLQLRSQTIIDPSATSQVEHATSGHFQALALHGPDAIAHWRALIGPTHVYRAQWTQPSTLRARYGLSDTRNGFHGAFDLRSSESNRPLMIWSRV